MRLESQRSARANGSMQRAKLLLSGGVEPAESTEAPWNVSPNDAVKQKLKTEWTCSRNAKRRTRHSTRIYFAFAVNENRQALVVSVRAFRSVQISRRMSCSATN